MANFTSPPSFTVVVSDVMLYEAAGRVFCTDKGPHTSNSTAMLESVYNKTSKVLVASTVSSRTVGSWKLPVFLSGNVTVPLVAEKSAFVVVIWLIFQNTEPTSVEDCGDCEVAMCLFEEVSKWAMTEHTVLRHRVMCYVAFLFVTTAIT